MLLSSVSCKWHSAAYNVVSPSGCQPERVMKNRWSTMCRQGAGRIDDECFRNLSKTNAFIKCFLQADSAGYNVVSSICS